MTLSLYHRIKFVAPLFSLFLLFAAASFPDDKSDKPFTEVRSPNFRVLTNGSQHDARRIALEFEQMRAVFAVAFPKMRLTTAAPLLIFAVLTENDMKALAPAMWQNHKGPLPQTVTKLS